MWFPLKGNVIDNTKRMNSTMSDSVANQGKHNNEYFLNTVDNGQLELGSLREYMDMNCRLNENELRDIASCCLLGLDFLHSRYIMHGVVEH